MISYGGRAEGKAMVKIQTSDNKLDNSESSLFIAFTQGIKISKINAKLKEAIDLPVLIGEAATTRLSKNSL